MSKGKVSFDDIDAEPVTAEETQALAEYADRAEVMQYGSGSLMKPDFVKIDKNTAVATIGQDGFELLRPGMSADCVILYMDDVTKFLKSDPDNPMAPPTKWPSEQAALADGEVTQFGAWGSDIKPTVAPYRDIMLLVKCPGDPNPAFDKDLAGAEWALGAYSMGRTAYLQNAKNDKGIIRTINFYTKTCPVHQILWAVTPVLHKYTSGFTSGYLKFSFKKLMKADDPLFLAIESALGK